MIQDISRVTQHIVATYVYTLSIDPVHIVNILPNALAMPLYAWNSGEYAQNNKYFLSATLLFSFWNVLIFLVCCRE